MRETQRRLLVICLCVVVAVASGNAAVGREIASVWFAPNDPLRRPFGVKGADDFNQVFASTRDWPLVARQVKVVQLYTYYVLYAPDDDLKRIFAFLSSHQMDLSLEIGVLPASRACGLGVEGYDGKLLMRAADRISRLGGVLSFVAMDEPLWHGAHFIGARACHSNLEVVADQAAVAINELHSRYPNIKVGQIEVFPLPAVSDWQVELLRWADDFQRLTHHPLAFFHADVIHSPDAPIAIKALQSAYQTHKIPFGYIDTGSSLEQSGASWAAEASELYAKMEIHGVHPESIVFQSWMNLPHHLLPESDSSSLTGVVEGYLRSPTYLTAHSSGSTVELRLEDGSGRPLRHELLHLEMLDGASARELRETITDVVPRDATTALFGIRGNTECDDCSGSGRVKVVNVIYSEMAAGGQGRSNTEWTQSAGWDLELKVDDPTKINSVPFRVVAGKTFTLRFDETASSDAADGGYFSLIFRNSDGQEMSRFSVPFRALGKTLPSVETDDSGAASVTSEASGPLQIDFAGDAANRPSRLIQH